MKSRLPFLLFILSLFLLHDFSAFSQQIFFNKVIPPEGKPFGMITRITEDVNGYMWFATQNGAYRYDGVHYTPFVHDSLNTNSLAANWVDCIYAEQNGIIWFGTFGAGLDRLDLATGIFTHFHHDVNDATSISNDTVTAILRDKQGILWIGTHGGLNQVDPKTNKFIHYQHNATDPASISNNQVRAIYEDTQGTIWVGTGSPFSGDGGGPEDGGLNRLDKKTGKFTRYLHEENNTHSLSNNKVRAIYEDTKGNFWIGTAKNELHKMDRQKGTFERIANDPAHPEKLSGPPLTKESGVEEHITFITQDAAEGYWIGSLFGGLNYYNPKIGKTIHFNITENSSSGFNDNGTWFAYTSRDGILWISSNWNGGSLYRIDPFHTEFQHRTTSTWVNCFYEDPNGIFWIGTKGLVRKNLKTQQEKTWLYDSKNENSPATEWIVSIRANADGHLWLASHIEGGLLRFDPKTEKFTHFKHDEKDSSSLVDDYTHCLLFDNQERLWIGTHTGVSRMDKRSGLFTNYKYNSRDSLTLSSGQVYSIIQETNGAIWFATDGGMSRFDSKHGNFHRYLKDHVMKAVAIDAHGIIWAGGDNGFFYFDPEKDAFIKFTNSGIQTEIAQVLTIVEDDKNNLWINTTHTLIRVNEKRNALTVYTSSNGILPCNDCMWRESYKAKDGSLFMGTETGYYSFDPEDMIELKETAPLLHLIFSVGNIEMPTGLGSTLSPPVWEKDKITLNYNQNTFSFDFNAIDYKTSGKVKYLYKLENYDQAWIDNGTLHKVTYFNVPRGEYIFLVKAINSEGTTTEKRISVIFNPPWWFTWWAFCFYGIILAGFLLAIYLLAERQKTQQREMAHAQEIEKAYTELKATQSQLIQSEKMASLGELTAGIAHEIQNPLNFVNNFSEVSNELIDEMNTEIDKGDLKEAKVIAADIKQNLEKINLHGKRADAIVKGMLQHSRKSTGIKELTDINALADEYFRLSYHGMRAKDKSFNATMKTDFDPSLEKINVIPQDLGRVILNLINNAFYAVTEKKKQSGDGYEPTVSISTRNNSDKVIISVKDNGNGIPQKVLDKIFQPFFTTKPTGQGTGLGLSLSYDIVKAHGGEIKVETKEGEGQATGSEFVIHLPA